MAIWHGDVVTGLLQTEAYARHIISSYSRVEPFAPALVARMVRVRMRRQQVLDRHPGLELSVVLDESVLRRRIGDDRVMYDQLQRLAREADRPNLTLQILPLDAQHTVFGESFVIFRFGQDDDAILHDVVSAEQLRSGLSLEGERETYLHRIAFQMLADASLDPASSRALVLETADTLWSGARGARLSPATRPGLAPSERSLAPVSAPRAVGRAAAIMSYLEAVPGRPSAAVGTGCSDTVADLRNIAVQRHILEHLRYPAR